MNLEKRCEDILTSDLRCYNDDPEDCEYAEDLLFLANRCMVLIKKNEDLEEQLNEYRIKYGPLPTLGDQIMKSTFGHSVTQDDKGNIKVE